MPSNPRPVLLTLEMPEDLVVTSLQASSTATRSVYQHSRQFSLPESIVRADDYGPVRTHLLTREPVREMPGWSQIAATRWVDASARVRGRLMQKILESHLVYDARKEGRSVRERADRFSWLLEQPKEVSVQNGPDVNIFVCATFNHIVIDGKDCIVPDVRRKVRAKDSIWDEIQARTWYPPEEGADWTDDEWLLVKVASSKDKTQLSGARLVKIREDLNLNDPWADGQSESIVDYWRREGWDYSEEEASSIPVAEVKKANGRNTIRYPANQVYRQMSTNQWGSEIWEEMKGYLKLKPSEHFSHVRKAMRWLLALKVGGATIGSSIRAGWERDWDIIEIPSGLMAKTVLPEGDGPNLLNERGQWSHHLKQYNRYHDAPPPRLNIHYAIPPGFEECIPSLRSHMKGVFGQIPGWFYTDSDAPHIIPDGSRTQIRSSIKELVSHLKSIDGEVLVVSGLWEEKNRAGKIYHPLKYALTEETIAHQNLAIRQTPYGMKMKAPGRFFSHIINACQILIKMGIMPVPWSTNLGEIDIMAGIDIGRRGRNQSFPALAVAMSKHGKLWGTSSMMEPQLGEAIAEESLFDLLHQMVHDYELETGSKPRRILLLRDGNTPASEFDGFRKIANEMLEEGVDISWVTVPKQGAPRLLQFNDNGSVDDSILPQKGNWLKTGDDSGVIWTTGAGDLKPGDVGVPVGLRFEVLQQFSSDPMTTQQVAALLTIHAHASQASPFRSTRLPFPLHLADKLAKAVVRRSIPPEIKGNRFPAV